MKNDLHLERRMQKDLIVSEEVYISGLFDIVQWLILDMEEYAKEERRFFGIMPTYFATMRLSISEFNSDCTEMDCDIYGKIFYLLKPIIVNEFSRLENKKLSKADRLIVISKRILDLLELVGSDVDVDYSKEKLDNIKATNVIITKMFDRIRNDGKHTELKFMIGAMKDFIVSGRVGKSEIHMFSMKDEMDKRITYKQQPIKNNTIIEETQGKTIWTEEL